jgi:hypothetical protein
MATAAMPIAAVEPKSGEARSRSVSIVPPLSPLVGLASLPQARDGNNPPGLLAGPGTKPEDASPEMSADGGK